MAIEWYIRRGKEQWGPVKSQEFEKLVELGHLREGDLLWRNDWQEWRAFQITPAANSDIVSSCTESQALPQSAHSTSISRDVLTEKLTFRYINSRGIDIKEKSQYQGVVIFEELLNSILNCETASPDRQKVAEERFADLVSLVESFRAACNSKYCGEVSEHDECEKTLWRHINLAQAFTEGLDSVEACKADNSPLTNGPFSSLDLRRDSNCQPA